MRIIGNRGNTARKVQAVASGALASGDTVVVNADGTVSVVSATANPQSIGTPVTWQAYSQEDMDVVFDAQQEKFVVLYRDSNDSSKGKAKVGTASGTTVSFGSATVFTSNVAESVSGAYDSTNGKIVIGYRDGTNSNYGTAVVGTISGTSISFGTPAVFASAATSFCALAHDPISGKVLIAFRDQANSGYATAIVATVSGTSISFGSETLMASNNVASFMTNVYDSASGKFLIAYSDSNASEIGKGVVATISGTSVSAGSAVTFESSSAFQGDCATDGAGKLVISYKDSDDSNLLKSVVATISGTTPTFTAAQSDDVGVGGSRPLSITYDANADKYLIVFRKTTAGDNVSRYVVATMSGTTLTYGADAELISNLLERPIGAFDSVQNKILIAYADSSDSTKGKALVFTSESGNLTSENFIGIASNGYASGQAATINVKGFIDDNQSSLTAGQSYFVQTNGDLGLTADDPSVFAGTAVSATKLIVKG